MSKIELIDDYLANRLSIGEKASFEMEISTDPSLKADVEFQQQIIEGVRKARATELKQMLNNIPAGVGIQVDFSVARIAAGFIGAGIIAAATYFYIRPDAIPSLTSASADLTKKSSEIIAPSKEENVIKEDPKNLQPEETKVPDAPLEEKKAVRKKEPKMTEARKPNIQVLDPSDELTKDNHHAVKEEPVTTGKSDISPSHVDVELDSSSKKYDFHYQFAGNKLMLFGPFDKSLYEVLEINGNSHALFLFYKENYYLLDESESKITRLTPIKDDSLLKKLKEYRNR